MDGGDGSTTELQVAVLGSGALLPEPDSVSARVSAGQRCLIIVALPHLPLSFVFVENKPPSHPHD